MLNDDVDDYITVGITRSNFLAVFLFTKFPTLPESAIALTTDAFIFSLG